MLLFSSQQSCEVEWVPLEMGSWGTLCDLLMAAQLPKELTWNSCWSVGSRLGQSFYYYTMHVPAAKELFHIVLNRVGLCVIIIVTCNGKTTFLFYRYNRLTRLRYISRVKPTSSLSCFVTASIRWAHTIASLHLTEWWMLSTVPFLYMNEDSLNFYSIQNDQYSFKATGHQMM